MLTEAEAIINGPRQDSYGHAFDSFTLLSKLWEPVLGVSVTPEQVGLCLVLLKVARSVNDPSCRDHLVDIAGFAGCLDKIQERRTSIKNNTSVSFSTVAQPSPVVAIPEPLHVIAEDAIPGAEVE